LKATKDISKTIAKPIAKPEYIESLRDGIFYLFFSGSTFASILIYARQP